MRLRNKRTGEIGELQVTEKHCAVAVGNGTASCGLEIYSSLARLYEEWEDYEEPKDYWYIEPNGVIARIDEWDCCTDSDIEIMKTLGNYFETKEEAEKAVEKLKALQRLKDNGMIKYSFHKEKTGIDLDFYTLTILAPRDKDSLTLLFGGEE